MPSASALDIASGILIAAFVIGLFLLGWLFWSLAQHPDTLEPAIPKGIGGFLILVAVCLSVWLIFRPPLY
jgi:hypothetical protein